MRRPHIIQLRVDDAERKALRANARAFGLTVSAFLRLRGLGLLGAIPLRPAAVPPRKRAHR